MNYMELQVKPENIRLYFLYGNKSNVWSGSYKNQIPVDVSNEKEKVNKNLDPLNVCSDGECQ